MVSLDGQWTSGEPDATALSENSLMVRTIKKSLGEVRISFPLFILIIQIPYSSLSKLLIRTSH